MKALRNFHVPLPDDLYRALRQESERTSRPATVLAREAIRAWLFHRERAARSQAVTEYAEAVAGSQDDLDVELEMAGIESWRDLP
jgi:predicted transcriptional regulator